MADFLAKPLNGLSQETSRPNIRSFQAPQPGSPIQEPETIKVPRIRSLGQSFGRIDQANKALRMQLSVSQEPLSEAAKVESARLMAKKLGLSLGYVLDNYDQISENITGIANNPQGALEYIANQYRGGASFIKEARLWAELRKDPSSARRPFILEEIQNLRDDLPPLDTSEKSWLMGSIGSAANMIPYTWAVGKYMVPGAALSLVTRGAAGKSQLATGLAMAASLITTAGKAVSFAESLDLAGGIIFGDLMEMTDEQGNPIDEAVAQTISGWARLPYAAIETISAEFLITGSSPLAKLLKKIPSGALEKAYTRAAARTVNALGLKGSYRALANMMVRSGGAVVSQAATGVSGEVMEEVAQGNIQIVAEELAKQITNELTGSEFQSITGAEWRDEMTETVEQTVGAVLVLQTPWMIKGGIDAQRQYNKISQNNAALRKAEAESEITEFLKTASDEEADIILEQQLAEAEEEAFQDIEFKTGEDKVTATTRTGTQAGTISYTVTEDSVVIDNLTLPDPTKTEVAAQLVEQVRDQFPDLNIDFSELSETATTISRAVEDLDITLREFNTQIDQANFKIEQNEQQIEVNDAEIKILQADLAEAEDEKAIGSLQVQIAQKQEESQTARESIELSQTRVNRLEEAKNTQRQKLPEETRDFTPEEFQEKVEGPAEAKERFINTPAGEAFRQTLEDNLPNLSSEEIDAVIRLVELRANAVGVSAEVWIKENLIEGVFASAEKARELAEGLGEEVPDDFFEDALGVTLFDEGRALIVATGATDFTTMVHELGHIFRRDLSEAEQKTAYDWARKESKEKKDTGNWTVKMEEAFATSFENYIYTGKTEHAEMKSIFQKFAEFMQSIFQVVKDLELAPEIRGVFENLLTDERIEALKDGTAEAIEAEPLILFQKAPVTTKYRKAIRKAFKQGAFISDETLASLGETWADKELEKRVEEAQKLEDFSWLANIARESGTYAEFKEESELYMGPKVDQLKNEAWLKEFYEAATREQGVTDINTGNAQWVAGLTDEFITGMIQEISQDIDAAKKAGIPVAITSQAIRFAAKGSINEKQIQIIRKTLQNRPSTYRQSISILIGDIEEAQRVDQERAFSEEIGIEDVSDIKPPEKKTRLSIAKKIDDVVTKKQVERGEINTKDINSLFQDGKKLLLASDKEVKKLEEDLRQHDRALAERLRKITDYNERQAILQKDETRQKIKDAIKKERARKTELLKQQKERKRLKEYARKLGAYITKKVPGSVHIDYREIIQEIQSGIDPNFRQKRKMT
ncbi:hypothetical protein KAR91_70010, partial [Candidatus Pacearchaeota archaeon]|nr:hypothetical protein [Candidatus Pacearchaeota archaeon]